LVDHSRGEQGPTRSGGVLRCTSGKTPAKKCDCLECTNAPEMSRELRPIFHGAELAFRIGIVVGGLRNVRFGDTQVGQQECYGLGTDRGAAIGMQCYLSEPGRRDESTKTTYSPSPSPEWRRFSNWRLFRPVWSDPSSILAFFQ
jgi:hypothetical protein